MDNAKQHWKILQELGSELANRVRSFLVIGKGGEGVIVVTENGDGYWLGEMRFGSSETKTASKPTKLNIPGLVQIAQSDSHIMLLNRQGQIYTIGMNSRRQLRLDLETRFVPQLIFIPHKIAFVRCGYGFCLALTEDGKVWAWGLNNVGQVGVPSSTRHLPSPSQILELDPYRVVAVECGSLHSLALTDQGEVYAWGCNNCGQLGDGSEESTHIPTRIPIPSPVQSMAAGFSHTLLLTRNGEVCACGQNQHGQLDPNQTNLRLSKVAGLPPISQIASHPLTDMSIAMSFDQRCFVWGKLPDQTIIITTPRELPPFYSTVESPLSFYSSHRNTPHSVTIPETHPSLFTRMSRMFDNPETSDVQFVVEQRTIHAHQIILSNSSDYFTRMFSETWLPQVNPIVRVTIPDYSYQVFHSFLRFLYTDCFELHPDLFPELFDLTSQYLESDLQQLCLSRMRTTLTPTTCCLYYQLTHRHSLPELAVFQQELVQFIATNYLEVLSTDVYQSMSAKLCKKLTLSMATHSP